MRFQDCLFQVNKEKFLSVMNDWHVKEEEQKLFLAFIERLKQEKKEESEGLLDCTLREEDGIELPDVVVWHEGDAYAIDFTPWKSTIGYLVKEEALHTIGLEAFVFHVLYDMSFDGFDEDERSAHIDRIMGRFEEWRPNESNSLANEDNKDEIDLDDIFDYLSKKQD